MEIEQAQQNGQSVAAPVPMWKIVMVAATGIGVQFGWALQFSLLTPYVQTLGVRHAYATFVWLCGPISGLLVQPLVGHFSDRCRSRMGRRRPFIVVGACFVVVAVLLISMAKDIGRRAGDGLDEPTKPRAVAVFVTGFWILDVSNNMLQGPTRAFLADLSAGDHRRMKASNAYYAFFMALGSVLGYAAGSFRGLHQAFPFTRTEACNEACANLKSCFILQIILLAVVIGAAVVAVGEEPLREEEETKSNEARNVNFLRELWGSFRRMEKPMWVLLAVTAMNWVAWFPFLLYDTDWMAREVFGGRPQGPGGRQKEIYERGVRAGALGLMLNSIVQGLASLVVEPASRALGGASYLWGAVNVVLALTFASTVLVSKLAEAWRRSLRPELYPPPSNIVGGALAIFAVLGIPMAVVASIPCALASIYCSMAGGGQGLSLGVLNLAVVIPQMIISLVSGPLDGAFGGGNLPAFVMSSVAALLSSAMAIFFLPNPKQHNLPRLMNGVGH